MKGIALIPLNIFADCEGTNISMSDISSFCFLNIGVEITSLGEFRPEVKITLDEVGIFGPLVGMEHPET